MTLESTIYAYNQLLNSFFKELAPAHLGADRNELGLTALSEGSAKESIRDSQRLFQDSVMESLEFWQDEAPDTYDAAMEVLLFNP